jgi:hypothetical protein
MSLHPRICRPQAIYGDAAAFCIQVEGKGAPLHPSSDCDDQRPLCRSGNGARCTEASRSAGTDGRRLTRSRGVPEPGSRIQRECRAPDSLVMQRPRPAAALCHSDKRRSEAGREELLATPISLPSNERLVGAACIRANDGTN